MIKNKLEDNIINCDLGVNNTTLIRLSLDGDTNDQTVIITDNQSYLDDADFSTVLNVASNSSGLGIPQLTSEQIDGIVNPRIGMILYNMDTDTMCIYTKTRGWCDISLSIPNR